MNNIVEVIHEMVLENELPAKVIAEKVNKPYSTLLREINQYDKSAKLGVETLIELMQITRSVAPLEFMADQLGYSLAPKAQKKPKRAPTPLRPNSAEAPRLRAANG
jgi:hypothetical protein